MTPDFKIFKANRLKYNEMYDDVNDYIRSIYKTNNQEFSISSPFAQIINVVLHLGRMILYYIETSITELNIATAFHERSVRGLATLTGHTPSSGIAARGALYMTYKNNSDYAGQTIRINNFTRIRNTSNGLNYLAVFPGKHMRLTVGAHDSKIEIPIIQGEIKYQQATGTGYALQSFNFANKSNEIVDNFFVNIYVNGEQWTPVVSLLDMGYNQKACIVKTSFNGGIDVFFGTGNSGAVPEQGASILCEYIVTAGPLGNILETDDDNYWTFDESGYDIEGDMVDLNEIYSLSSASEVLFGVEKENIDITRQLAPNVSRSFVLANALNYKYFLSRLNMFSIIDAFSGFNTVEDSKIEKQYLSAKNQYEYAKESYMAQVNLTGKDSDDAKVLYEEMLDKQNEYDILKQKYDDSKLDDNIVYLYLLPDISKRINAGENYFTCSKDRFLLTEDEKQGIINLIDDSGQKIITVENKILDPVFVNFAINIFVQMWGNYNFNAVKSSIITTLSNYFIRNVRRDRIPLSDLIRIVEAVPGVDSVSIFFDADKNNSYYYGEGNYGIDEYGDIVLSRLVSDKLGNIIEVNDLQPMFRGGFTSAQGIEYGTSLDDLVGPINITLRGRS
jgi:hypothetical protein